MLADVATSYYWQRRYEQAIEQFRKALDLDPAFPPALQFLGQTYTAMELYDKAIEEFDKVKSITSIFGTRGFIGYAYAKRGKRSDAERVLAELQAEDKGSYFATDALAVVYTGLGDRNRAFHAWQSSCRRIGAMQAVKVDPIFDDLRSDPRFPDLVRCVGLTP